MGTYVCSDIHGSYDLFMRLLDACGITDGDTVYILGDVLDKGKDSFRLLDFVRRTPNLRLICGNHEQMLKDVYQEEMRRYTGDNEELVLRRIRRRYPECGTDLDWDLLEFVDGLPYFVETEDFIGVHAGVELTPDGKILPLARQDPKVLVYDRHFQDPDVIPVTEKPVLFGHTPTCYENGTGEFIKTPRRGRERGTTLSDYAKIRLDTGVFFTGRLGMLRVDDLREFYVNETFNPNAIPTREA